MRRTRFKFEPPIMTFRVCMLRGMYAPEGCEQIWREIEVTSNQRLDELGEAIPLAFDFDDPHLWSFFFGTRGKPDSVEYTSPVEYGDVSQGFGPVVDASTTAIKDAPFPTTGKQKEVEYLFDFGDEWIFGVTLVGITLKMKPGTRYPRLVAREGASPPQYPRYEDEFVETDE